MGLNFSKNEFILVCFTSELKNFVAHCVFLAKLLYIVLHDFNLTYYSIIILGSFSILLFPKLCWHIGLTPTCTRQIRQTFPPSKFYVIRYIKTVLLECVNERHQVYHYVLSYDDCSIRVF